jgi:hypothetical protein
LFQNLPFQARVPRRKISSINLPAIFFEFAHTQAHFKARTKLANTYWIAAYDSEVKEVWEKSLSHYLEILRLDVSDPSFVRFRVPFILLYINRDNEAYSFIRYWLSEKEDYRVWLNIISAQVKATGSMPSSPIVATWIF